LGARFSRRKTVNPKAHKEKLCEPWRPGGEILLNTLPRTEIGTESKGRGAFCYYSCKAKMRSFRIATYNIHKFRGIDRRVRPQRIAEVLKQTGADIIALQEVVGMDEGTRERNHIRAIAEELGFDFRIGENRRLRGGAYGNAVLTRLPIVAHRNYDITWRGKEARGCLQVAVAYEDGERKNAQGVLQIYNLHLGTAFFERRYQARRLLDQDLLGDRAEISSPRIVLGDLNEWTRGLASRLLSRHFNTASPRQYFGRAWSYPGILPFLHVDHIYYDSLLELQNITVHRSRLALVASDHVPLVADFAIPSTPG
jgi:endonuclease/exonuclease/phosphatase family metal-dependent hydrolase